MIHTIRKYTMFKLIIQVTLVTSFIFGFSLYANAQSDFTATLDVDDSVVVGETATLEWYVTGGPATCTINHGVGTFEVTTNPQSGTVEAVPPVSGEPFLLSCARGGDGTGGGEIVTDDLVVIPDPIITFTAQYGTNLVNSLSGGRRFWLDWEADYATECSAVTYTQASDPTTVRNFGVTSYRRGGGDSGRTRYLTSGGVRPTIHETTTFYITCENQAQGTETTKEITVVLVDPPPPEPVTINVIRPVADPAIVTRDEVRNYGQVRYEFTAMNASYCTDYKAYNVHEYPTVETSLPPGYSAWSGSLRRRIDLRLGTSTVLSVRCGRPEVTIGGITYPATSTTLVKTFTVTPGDATTTSTSTDTIYATAHVSVSPNSVERNAYSGTGFATANITAANADYCYLRAYRVADGTEYSLGNWTRPNQWTRVWTDGSQNLDRDYVIQLSESSVLEARCLNVYDRYYGTDEDYENSVVYATTTVLVTEPTGPIENPTVWLYSGPSLHLTADDVWDLQTTNNNMKKANVRHGLNREHIWVDASYDGSNNLINQNGSITFTFSHPHGADTSSVYNIHMRHCDESEGEAYYTFSTSGSGEVGTHVSNKQYPGQGGRCDSSTLEVDLVAEGVVLTDGDEITVACTASQAVPGVRGAEYCQFSDLYLGTGSGNRVVTVPAATSTPENLLIWMSEGATECGNMVAETSEGTDYVWSYSSRNYGSLTDSAVGSITTYDVTCSRPIDSVETTEDIEVIISSDPDIPLDPEETVSDEASYEVGACWDVAPDPDVLVSSAPTDHVVAPDDLHLIPDTFVLRSSQCVPLVDLSVSPVYRGTNLATDSVIDIADGVDNVNGTYNLSIVPYVQNLANIDLPQDASIPYRVTLSGGSVSETNSGFYNQLLPANTPSNVYQLTDDRYDGIQFGTYDVEVRFNMDGTPNYPDSDFSNNRFTDSVVLAVPEPHMTILMSDGRPIIDNSIAAVETPLVRSGFSTNINWSVNVNYPLNCTLTGPGIGTQNLTLGTVGSNNFGTNPSGDQVPISLQSSGEFQLECTEPVTGQVFTHVGTVEVVPDFQEL